MVYQIYLSQVGLAFLWNVETLKEGFAVVEEAKTVQQKVRRRSLLR